MQVARLFDINRGKQAWDMVLARNFAEWRSAMSYCAIPMFNVVYADRAGNIFYAYNGAIPVRDPALNWRQPVDGSDPRTEWKGFHMFDQLPQVLNPEMRLRAKLQLVAVIRPRMTPPTTHLPNNFPHTCWKTTMSTCDVPRYRDICSVRQRA